MASNTKMITVKSRGFVMTSRGRLLAPIRTPYRESLDRIWGMISQDRADVYERLENGEDILLTAQNFDQDNNAAVSNQQATAPVGAKSEGEAESKPEVTEKESEPQGEVAQVTEPASEQEATEIAPTNGEPEVAPETEATPAEEPTSSKNSKKKNKKAKKVEEPAAVTETNPDELAPVVEESKPEVEVTETETTPEEKKEESASLEAPVEEV